MIQNDTLNEKTPEECVDQNENKTSFNSVNLIPNMVNGFSQNLNFAFPWVNKSQPTDEVEVDVIINDKSKSQDASSDSISNEKQISKDTSNLQENCCPELCKEVSAEARTLAKDARHLSNEMSEIMKEADILNKKASEVAHLCDGGIQGDTGIVSSMIGFLTAKESPAAHMSANQNEQKCVIDYTPSIKETEKLIKTLESAKDQIIKVKELSKETLCTDGLLDEQNKQKQNSLLQLLELSKISAEGTSKMILESESSIKSQDTISIQKRLQEMNNKFHCTEIGIFILGLGFGASCGYMIGHVVLKAKEKPSEN